MIDIKLLRSNPDLVKNAVLNKNEKIDLDKLLSLDSDYRQELKLVEEKKAIQNKVSKEIAQLKRDKQDASDKIDEMQDLSKEIKEMNEKVSEMKAEIDELLLWIPNLPHESTPIGKDESANVIVKEWGEKKDFGFEPQAHWDLAEKLDIIDLPRGAKITGSGFVLYKGLGAKLERALINWMLDLHIEKHGYTEILPPFIVNRETMKGTGQIPKLENDMYVTKEEDLFLIPTAEVPVTNIHRDEIMDGENLPLFYVAQTPCFRREAGSYGKDTRGIIRVHQFNKVEMVKFVFPETSYDELENLTRNAEEILEILNLPYQRMALATGDLSFAAAKCYDLNVYCPGVDKYLEVSSCSNFEDFQARRANIRFRRKKGEKPEFVHTLNGSGLALPRLVIAVIENYQTADGRIMIPEVLRPYMGNLEYIG